MKAILLLLIIHMLGCSNGSKNKTELKHYTWVNYDLMFDTTFADDKSSYTVYGSGTLLFLDTNQVVKSFTNTFIKHNDSLGWGEPGVILTNGNWKWEGTSIITTNKLIEKTFILPTDTIGSITIDNYVIKGDTLIRNKKEKFIPVKFLTTELNTFLNSDWNKIEIRKTTAKSGLVNNETIPNRDSSLSREFKKYKIHNLTDTINTDLNGDKIPDFIFFSTIDNKKGILIIDGQTKNQTKVGLDNSFGELGDDFGWVDFWGTTGDKETYEIVIKDSEIIGNRKVKLSNHSIFVRNYEVGGGVITYKGNRFIWVHQAD